MLIRLLRKQVRLFAIFRISTRALPFFSLSTTLFQSCSSITLDMQEIVLQSLSLRAINPIVSVFLLMLWSTKFYLFSFILMKNVKVFLVIGDTSYGNFSYICFISLCSFEKLNFSPATRRLVLQLV